jgi:hypothetical protein
MRAAIVAFDDPGFASALRERGAELTQPPARDLDLVFLLVRQTADLDRLAELRPLIRPNGAIWVLRTKGPAATVRDVDVIDAGQRHRLVDNKIASFSDELAAMRLVIRITLRGR